MKKEVIRDFLSEEELQTLNSKGSLKLRLNHVRDIFIFTCFTGLAFIDTKTLRRSDVAVSIDGEKWIFTKGKKTDSPTRIPLSPTVLHNLLIIEAEAQERIGDKTGFPTNCLFSLIVILMW